MWSPVSPVSNENQSPETQTVCRKSVGRTPLRVLGALDPNSLDNQRLSLLKSSIRTVLLSKETSKLCAVPPVGLTVDKSPGDIYAEGSTTQNSSLDSKNSQSNSTEVMSKILWDNQLGQPSDADMTCLTQKLVRENKIANCFNADCNTMARLSSDKVDDEHVSAQKEHMPSCFLKADYQISNSSDMLSCKSFNVCSEVRSGRLPVAVPDLNPLSSIHQENVDSLVSDAAHSLPGKEARLENSLLTIEDEVHSPEQAEARVVSANSTFVISSYVANDSTHFLLLRGLSGESSCLSSRVEDCGTFEKGKEGFHIVPNVQVDSLECDPQTERLPSYLTDDTVSEDKTDEIVDLSSAFWDSAEVLNKADGIIGNVILTDECSLPLDAPEQADKLTVYEECSCNVKNHTDDLDLQESINKCFNPIGGSTPHSKELVGIKETDSEQVLPTTQQTSHSSLMPDPQSSEEADASDKCCPTPVIPPKSRTFEGIPLGRSIGNKITPRVLASLHDFGTSTTPVSTSDDFTWMTPIMLLNKSMNTSWNLKGKGQRSARDNSSETDSLLWNFSKESLCNASREELVDRLEGTLIVVEVLSKQLQGWQQTVCSKPSEQRDCCTQTCASFNNEVEQYYHNLYLNTLSRQQSLQCDFEDDKRLHQLFKEASESLSTYKSDGSVMVEFAENLYKMVQQDRAVLNQKVKCTQTLLADYITALSRIHSKIKANLLEKEEMKSQMEKAMLAKEVAYRCLKDLQVLCSTVFAELRQDLETEKQLCDLVRDVYQQQHSCNEELVDFVQRAHSSCCEVEDDRTQLRIQCSQAKEQISRHWRLFNVMKMRTQSTLGEYEKIKNELDNTVLENQQMCAHVEELTSLNKQMELENSRLGSELESLMKTVFSLETDIEQWRLENAELSDKLSAKALSLKLLEKELNEATARGLEYQDHIKYLSGEVLRSLELELSKALSEKETLKTLKRENASQIASYKESLEFLEQENEVCREQVKEIELQLKTDHANFLKRNYQCENLKDTIKELEKEIMELKQHIAEMETEAQNMKVKMREEISNSSTEASKIKACLLDVVKGLKENSQTEINVTSYGQQTPGGSLTFSSTSMEESLNNAVLNTADSKGPRLEGIWSEKSAFTVVQPLATPFEDIPVINLADLLHDLSSIVMEVVTASSFAMGAKQRSIRELKMNISSLKEQLHSQQFQHKSDVRDVQQEVEWLKRRIGVLDEKLCNKEKYIKGLQELVQQFQTKITQQIEMVNENEDLKQENAKLKLCVKLHENELNILKAELAKNPTESARNWVQEKIMLQKDLITMTMKLNDTEYSKAEVVQKLNKHKDILKANLIRSEAEVQKLDDIIEKIREALHSVPDVVKQCDTLKQLVELLN